VTIGHKEVKISGVFLVFKAKPARKVVKAVPSRL
jgi:hypothetical protein